LAGGVEDNRLGGAGGIDHLRLAIVVVPEDRWGNREAGAVADTDIVIDPDAERSRR
jgi:hypothetical protein